MRVARDVVPEFSLQPNAANTKRAVYTGSVSTKLVKELVMAWTSPLGVKAWQGSRVGARYLHSWYFFASVQLEKAKGLAETLR